MEDAVSILKDIYPKFDALCKDSKNTVKSLAYYLRNEEVDPFIQFLLITLYDYLGGNAFSICTEPQYSNYNLVLPSGKVIKAKKYIGSSTPDEYDSIKNYPSVVKVGAESYRYNCHSYAWYYGGNISGVAQGNLAFIDWARPYFNSSPTCAIRIYGTPQPGDIVLYRKCPCQDNIVSHSAIITSTSSVESKRKVRSKWGYYGVYTHDIFDCPYYTRPHAPGYNCNGSLEYWRVTHDYRSYAYLNHKSHARVCHYCGPKPATVSPHTFIPTGSKYVCTLCGYSTTTPVFPNMEVK